jgi:acyl-CoA hydrolase
MKSLTTWTPEGDHHTWTVPEGWGQGRAVFGGLVAAAAVNLASGLTDRPLRTLQLQMLRPLKPGRVQGRRELLREGRNVTAVRIDLLQDDSVATTAIVTFLVPRDGTTDVAAPEVPDFNRGHHFPIPYMDGLTPEFTQHLEMSFLEGTPPFMGAPEPKTGGFVGYRDKALDDGSTEATVGLMDAFPSPTMSILSKPAVSSTATWTLHLLAPPEPGLHAYRYSTLAATGGASTTTGMVWAPSGALAAYTEQTVVTFE